MKYLKIKKTSEEMLRFLKLYKLISVLPPSKEVMEQYEISKNKIIEKKSMIEEKINMLKEYDKISVVYLSKGDYQVKEVLKKEIVELTGNLHIIEEEHFRRWKFLEEYKKYILEMHSFDLLGGYKQSMSQHKNGQFFEGLKSFAKYLGIEGVTQAEIKGTAMMMKDRLVFKIKFDENFNPIITSNQFDRVFLDVFCDLYVNLSKKDEIYYQNMIKLAIENL